jgi:aspartate carbamoyltransferase catalytic subunit
VGDVRNSRVARSGVACFSKLGAHVTLVAPPTLLPERLDGWPCEVAFSIDDLLAEVDVVYALRVQQERLGAALFPSLREYYTRYGITVERAERMKPDAVVMHPGPMIRGPEIATEVADSPRSLVREQVANGVAVRMAVLWDLVGSGGQIV